MSVSEIPLLIEFAASTTLIVERDRPSMLPIIGNGPPGTFVVFPGGLRVSLPTDQIVFSDVSNGRARIGFGGMGYVGMDAGQLVFLREREVLPDARLSPARSHVMRLDPGWVTTISVAGQVVWPRATSKT